MWSSWALCLGPYKLLHKVLARAGLSPGSARGCWQHLVPCGCRAESIHFFCFSVVVACWPEAALSSQGPPKCLCHVGSPNMATRFLGAGKGGTPVRQALGDCITSSHNCVHVITYIPAPLWYAIVWKQPHSHSGGVTQVCSSGGGVTGAALSVCLSQGSWRPPKPSVQGRISALPKISVPKKGI